MTTILAVETATDACSVALARDEVLEERHRVAPRQHSQLLFSLLDELLPPGRGAAQALDAVAYGSGPGSFTGLRIAASAAQGIAYARAIPAVAVPTLAVLAQTALAEGMTRPEDMLLCTLDARDGEVYAAVYRYRGGLAERVEGPVACAPEALRCGGNDALVAVGSGCRYADRFHETLRERLSRRHEAALPRARDMLPLARVMLEEGDTLPPAQVLPVYVRDEISWKKLAEQGKRN